MDNVINVDERMACNLGTPRTVKLARAEVQLISKLEEESISARALLGSISDASFVTERTIAIRITEAGDPHNHLRLIGSPNRTSKWYFLGQVSTHRDRFSGHRSSSYRSGLMLRRAKVSIKN